MSCSFQFFLRIGERGGGEEGPDGRMNEMTEAILCGRIPVFQLMGTDLFGGFAEFSTAFDIGPLNGSERRK